MGLFKKMYMIKSESGLPNQDLTGISTIEFKDNNVIFGYYLAGGGVFPKMIYITLKPENLLNVSYDKTVKNSSIGKAATGALIGGLLTGGIGLIAGAAIGGKGKKEERLYVDIKIDGNESEVVILAKGNTTSIHNELSKIIQSKKNQPKKEIEDDEIQFMETDL